jgi:RimJ/RimL family protein N-acetyltransferase
MYTGLKTRLRVFRRDDIDVALRYSEDAELRRLITSGVPFPIRREDAVKWYERLPSDGDNHTFAIEDLETGRYIGDCNTSGADRKNNVVSIGLGIDDKTLWGKGYGTDALRVLVRFIFKEMNFNKIKLEVFSYNQRAIKSYIKCGFTQEAVQRQEQYAGGKYHDVIVMGLLREEWLKLQHAI